MTNLPVIVKNYLNDRGKRITSVKAVIKQLNAFFTLLANQLFCGQVNADADFDFNSRLELAPSFFNVIKYGALYNHYAGLDVRNMFAVDWHYSTADEWVSLMNYLGGNLVAGGKLKQIGFTNWDEPNLIDVNSIGFNAKAAGARYNGDFTGQGHLAAFSNSYILPGVPDSQGYIEMYTENTTSMISVLGGQKHGLSIRPVKDFTTLLNGEKGVYVGNDGKQYESICINGVEWLSSNLAETKYRNGDLITVEQDDLTWDALVTEAMCYPDVLKVYETDVDYVNSSFIVPLGVDNYIIASDMNHLNTNAYIEGFIVDYED